MLLRRYLAGHRLMALALLLCLLCAGGALALAEGDAPAAQASRGTLDDALLETVAPLVELAKGKLYADWDASVQKGPPSTGKLEIVHTILLLLDEEQPEGASEMQRKLWADYYADMRCVVCFTVIGDYYGSASGYVSALPGTMFGEYGITEAGEAALLPLSAIRAKTFADPIVPGMTLYDAGALYNETYTSPAASL